ncbi:hypothetical protein [Yersinia phage MHG19]|nr:hypothetical protein [Yersinia phage MHG19]
MVNSIAVSIESLGSFHVRADWVYFDDDETEYWEYEGNWPTADVESLYEDFVTTTGITVKFAKFIKLFIVISEAQKLVRHNQ